MPPSLQRLQDIGVQEFRAQVFNLTNTASFAALSGNENLATGGQVTATRNQPRLYESGLKCSFCIGEVAPC